MRRALTATKMFFWPLVSISVVLLAGCALHGIDRSDTNVMLNGAQEVPPLNTLARGIGTISIGADRSVSGKVTTSGIVATAAHIHVGAADQNGPVIIPLTKTVGDFWSVPAGAKLTDAQFESYKAGNLYVNVHTAANKGGEIRGQITRTWVGRWKGQTTNP